MPCGSGCPRAQRDNVVAGAGPFTGARWTLVIGANGAASLRGLIDRTPGVFRFEVGMRPRGGGLVE